LFERFITWPIDKKKAMRTLTLLLIILLAATACGNRDQEIDLDPNTAEETLAGVQSQQQTVIPTLIPTAILATPETLDRDFNDTTDTRERRDDLVDVW
jgi:hypothetical protein